MKAKSNETRRILNFPAIRPYGSVSFPTLTVSLLNLSHSIRGFKSKPIFTNKKNAKTSIHLIRTLIVFLEEITRMNRENSRLLESSVLLCLSELHFIFQKIHFLLEDCSRDDSRLWLLMQSERVSSHFRELIRAVAVALDVLPLSAFEISDEVRELVEFVRRQAMETNFEVEVVDKRSMRKVLRVIDRFKSGFAPESIDLKRVLEYLGIKTWYECDNEIRFLENLTRQECATTEKKYDVHFLSSLTAFLIYCRCVVFETLDGVRNQIVFPQHVNFDEIIRFLNPDDFRCPISLEIMTDPVTISTGHTYDRSSIAKWFESGNHTCPKTGERVTSVNLVPNLALKRFIRPYCLENGIPFPESEGRFRDSMKSSDAAGSSAAEQAMTIVADFLVGKLVAGGTDERNKACYEIRLLTKTSVFNRSCFIGANAIPHLLSLVHSEIRETQDNTMAGLLNLSKCSKAKKIIVGNRGLDAMIRVLNGGVGMETRRHAAGVLFYLSSVDEYRKTIGRVQGAVSGLTNLIRVGPGRAKMNGLDAVSGLLVCPENHRRVLSAGLVPVLVSLLASPGQREDVVMDALAVLATLAGKFDGAAAIVSAGCLPVIINILGSDFEFCSRGVKEHCVFVLLALCINAGPDAVPILVKNTSVMAGLYSVLADGSSGSSKKAGSLIGILHAFNEKISLMGSDFGREHFVHAW
ncbi:hypothetical protein OROGR_002123 [Orobanche gracilis]